MKKLLNGIVEFRNTIRPHLMEKFQELAHTQTPDTLLVACSDSRVVPNLFASTDPGDLFVVRNVGNLIPECNCDTTSKGYAEAAAIQFSLNNLPIQNVIICGHSSCAAMGAILDGAVSKELDHVNHWLQHGENALDKLNNFSDFITIAPSSRQDQLSQLNVIQQLEHLMTYPDIKKRVEEGTLKLHGWWFDIQHANVYAYHRKDREYVLIDETETQRILDAVS